MMPTKFFFLILLFPLSKGVLLDLLPVQKPLKTDNSESRQQGFHDTTFSSLGEKHSFSLLGWTMDEPWSSKCLAPSYFGCLVILAAFFPLASLGSFPMHREKWLSVKRFLMEKLPEMMVKKSRLALPPNSFSAMHCSQCDCICLYIYTHALFLSWPCKTQGTFRKISRKIYTEQLGCESLGQGWRILSSLYSITFRARGFHLRYVGFS